MTTKEAIGSYRAIDKALSTISGIIEGIAIDRKLNPQERAHLESWLAHYERFANQHPYNELIPVLKGALSDSVLAREDHADILWLCKILRDHTAFNDHVKAQMQRLQGILTGIAADGVITGEELIGLRQWLEAHADLSRCWPYDEVDGVVTRILSKGKLEAIEHKVLRDFFHEVGAYEDGVKLTGLSRLSRKTITGICVVNPKVCFDGRLFCFTGTSSRYCPQGMSQLVERLGGAFQPEVSSRTDFLIVGADGNPFWPFACYGRKVEQAVQLRKQGVPLRIVHEDDFHAAVVAAEC